MKDWKTYLAEIDARANETLKHYETMDSRKMGDPDILLAHDIRSHMQRPNLDIPNSKDLLRLTQRIRALEEALQAYAIIPDEAMSFVAREVLAQGIEE